MGSGARCLPGTSFQIRSGVRTAVLRRRRDVETENRQEEGNASASSNAQAQQAFRERIHEVLSFCFPPFEFG